MSRLVKRWIGLAIFVIVLGVAFVNLGQWQLRRLDERQHTNATVIAHRDAPVKPFAQAFTAPIADGDQWQRVEATGTYDAEHTVIIRYRNLAGATGVEVVTPLRTADRTVLVDRGFVAAGAGGEAPSVAPAPTGQVTVVGYVRRDENGPDNATIPTNGQARLINSAKIATTLPYPIVDGYLSLITPAEAGLKPMTPPSLDEGPHLSYALQWFSFTLIAVVGLVVFIRADLRDRRKARARAAAAATTEKEAPDGSRAS